MKTCEKRNSKVAKELFVLTNEQLRLIRGAYNSTPVKNGDLD
jgi:hypothetical protein